MLLEMHTVEIVFEKRVLLEKSNVNEKKGIWSSFICMSALLGCMYVCNITVIVQ